MASQTNMQVSPLRKGLVFDALMVTRIQDGDEAPSTVISCTVKWVKEEKLARLGNVNSPARRKPAYPSVHAAKTMQWSGRCTFRDFQINSMWLSVMGRRLDDKEPWDRLIPRITRCKRRQFCSGSGNPCSTRRANGVRMSPEKLQTDTECIHQWDKAIQRDEAGLAEDKIRRTSFEKLRV